jgi:DNA-binding transcriptional ArsR family regulator
MSAEPSWTTLPAQAPLFAALGDETRLELLARLSHSGPSSITSLTRGTGVTRQAVTKHLRVLESVQVARGARLGREHVWQFEPLRIDEARLYLQMISQQWDLALEKLRDAVEER